VSPAASSSWEEDVLGSDVLANGATRRINLLGYDSPVFDIRLTDEDNDTYTFFGIDVSARDLRVTIDDIDTAAETAAGIDYYLDVTNATDYTMMTLQISPRPPPPGRRTCSARTCCAAAPRIA